MNLEIILRSGLSTGTILIFAAIGEILTELSGIQNLGIEGMMLVGAMAAFKTSLPRVTLMVCSLELLQAVFLACGRDHSFSSGSGGGGLSLTF